ncbi:hypothetical protein JXL21_06960 [Candidatus Bathyarchaeota archaeon]|nr:hypothetical protein [Candidatus Bathyarchaeota archaeon]
MKKTGIVIMVMALLLLQPLTVSALTAGEAKQAWRDAKQASRDTQSVHRDAKIEWAADKTEENNQRVIDTGKDVLNAALDEAEAWLVWRSLEVEENPDIPTDLKDTIRGDVAANLAKIEELREEVEGVENRLELGIVFLKMVGKYLELLTDVARSTGRVWVHIANSMADTVEEYEAKLREATEGLTDNQKIIEALDAALNELETARMNIDSAEVEYLQVVNPGTPLIKFSNGNNYLRIAKNNLISAHGYLNEAYRLLVGAS